MQYLQSFPERVYKSMLMSIMVEDKRTGIKIVQDCYLSSFFSLSDSIMQFLIPIKFWSGFF